MYIAACMHVHVAPTCIVTHMTSVLAIYDVHNTHTHTLASTRTQVCKHKHAIVTHTHTHTHTQAQLLNYFYSSLYFSHTHTHTHTHTHPHTHTQAQLLNYLYSTLYFTHTHTHKHTKGKECAKSHQEASWWVNTTHNHRWVWIGQPVTNPRLVLSHGRHKTTKALATCTWWWHMRYIVFRVPWRAWVHKHSKLLWCYHGLLARQHGLVRLWFSTCVHVPISMTDR